MRFRRLIAIPLLMIVGLSCSSSREPRSNVTLLITNAKLFSGALRHSRSSGLPHRSPRHVRPSLVDRTWNHDRAATLRYSPNLVDSHR